MVLLYFEVTTVSLLFHPKYPGSQQHQPDCFILYPPTHMGNPGDREKCLGSGRGLTVSLQALVFSVCLPWDVPSTVFLSLTNQPVDISHWHSLCVCVFEAAPSYVLHHQYIPSHALCLPESYWVPYLLTVILLFSQLSVYAANAGEIDLIPGSENPPEKEMVTYSSILAWEILWTEEPCGLQSMGLQKSWTQLSD